MNQTTLNDAQQMLRARNFSEAREMVRILLENPDRSIQSQAERLTALAWYREKKYAEAFYFFERSARDSINMVDWFNLANCAILVHRRDVGDPALVKALSILKSSNDTQPVFSTEEIWAQAAYSYSAVGEFEEALKWLNLLKESYLFYKITERGFLAMRRVPPFQDALNFAERILIGLGAEFDALSWLDELTSTIDNEGSALVEEVKEKIRHQFPEMHVNDPRLRVSNVNLESRPLRLRIEAIYAKNGDTSITVRVLEGTLRLHDIIKLKLKDASSIESKVLTMERFKKGIESCNFGQTAVIRLSDVKREFFFEGQEFTS